MLHDITEIDHSKKRIEVELPHGMRTVPVKLTSADTRAYLEMDLPSGAVRGNHILNVELPFVPGGESEYPVKVYADAEDQVASIYTLAFKRYTNTLELSEIKVNGRKAKRDENNPKLFTIDVMPSEKKANIIAKSKKDRKSTRRTPVTHVSRMPSSA